LCLFLPKKKSLVNTITMDKQGAGFWKSTNLFNKRPPYSENESTDKLTSNPDWTAEKPLDEILRTSNGPTPRFRESTLNNGQPSQKYIDWGEQWQQQPAFIVLCVSFGLLLAVGHHIFYLRLNHTPAGTQARQQIAHAFGNVLSISVATSFAFTCRAAYKQYFWRVVRCKSFTIRALDSLFSLTSDVLGLLNSEVWDQAPLAAFLALACW
jgi:hypothetical protein